MGKNGQAPSQRQLRIGEEIRHTLSKIFLEEDFVGSDLEGVSITVSEVRISPDLKNATVFVSPLGGKAPENFIKLLNTIAPQLQHILGKSLKLRYIPKLFFKFDDSFEKAHKMEMLFESVKSKPSPEDDV